MEVRTQSYLDTSEQAEQGFDFLYTKYARSLVGYLVRSFHLQEADAEDIASEAWTYAITRIDDLREQHKFWPWLKRIAHTRTLNWMKRRRPRAATDCGQDFTMDQLDTTFVDEDSQGDVLGELEFAMTQVAQTHRTGISVLFQAAIMEETLATIAQNLHISQYTAWRHQKWAIGALRNLLLQRGNL